MNKTTEPITAQLEAIKEDICDNYCKHYELLHMTRLSDEMMEAIYMTTCDKCPLNFI